MKTLQQKQTIALIAAITITTLYLGALFYYNYTPLLAFTFIIITCAFAPYIAISAKQKQQTLHNQATQKNVETPINHKDIVFQTQNSPTPTLLYFTTDGVYTGKFQKTNLTQTEKIQHTLLKTTPFATPGTYELLNSHNQTLATITEEKKEGHNLNFHLPDGTILGRYEATETFQTLRKKGTLAHKNGDLYINIEAKNNAGDFHLTSQDNRFIASYMNGFFPFALKKIFQNDPNAEHFKIGDQLTEEEKLLTIAFISYWRSKARK